MVAIVFSQWSPLLFWVELFRENNNKFDTNGLKYNYSLEHVMPQKWEEHWQNIPEKKNQNGSVMSTDEAKKEPQGFLMKSK